jgi:hypothetical protein
VGKDAEDFRESDLGKVILGMAKQDLDAAVERMARANLAEQYLMELISRARETFDAYKQQKEGQ